MAKAKKKRKTQNALVERFIRPTEAREAHNDFRSVGAAVQVVPVIVRLHEQGVLNDREFAALAYYRDQASLADKSPVKSNIDFSVRGGSGPGVAIVSAALETGRMERDMGALWTLCRAIAVDDTSLAEWVDRQHGTMWAGRMCPAAAAEKLRMLIGIATFELKYAAGGIVVGRAA